MMVVSIAVTWLVVGLIVALAFGAAVSRTSSVREEDELPQRAGAELRYFRRQRRTNCDVGASTPKKFFTKHITG